MRIGIMSDSHGDISAVEKAVALAGPVAMWLHAGDCVPDANYLKEISKRPVVCVAGNTDWGGLDAADEETVTVAGHRIFIAHGHYYGVRYSHDALREAAGEKGADIAVYGHTHVAVEDRGNEKDDVIVLNPGSVARPRDEMRGSFMVVTLEENKGPVVKLIRMDLR